MPFQQVKLTQAMKNFLVQAESASKLIRRRGGDFIAITPGEVRERIAELNRDLERGMTLKGTMPTADEFDLVPLHELHLPAGVAYTRERPVVNPNAQNFWEYSRPMREASRRYLAHKVVVAAKPSTGIYWWIPQPDGQWHVLAFADEFYPMNTHDFMWKHVVDHLQTLYPTLEVTGDLGMTYAGLPRGRIMENRKRQISIYQGNDSPGDLALVRQQFNLPANVRVVFDEHEQMLDMDKGTVDRALGRGQ